MAVDDAIWAYGTQLQMGEVGGSLTTITRVMDITGPGLTRDVLDVTDHSSPNGFEEILPTLKRMAEITFSIHYIPTDPTHDATTGLISFWQDSAAKLGMKLIFPDDAGTEWEFNGYVVGFVPGAPVAGALTADVTVKPSGEPVLA